MIHDLLNQYNSNFYSALVEFHQGAPLLTVWSQNSSKIEKIDDFLSCVCNIHSIGKEGEILIPPTITQSSFNGCPYFSITIQIPDVEARGFLRVINLIVAHESTRPIVSSDLIEIMKEFQQNSLKIFLKEVSCYFLSVSYEHDLLDDSNVKKTVLQAMIKEMTPILASFKIDQKNSKRDENLTLDKILILSNELRKIEDLIGFKEENLEKLIGYINNVSTYTDFPLFDREREIDFGIPSISMSRYLSFSSKIEDICTLNAKITNCDVFGHIIFSLLAGYKLAIISEDESLSVDLANQLINFVPLFDLTKLSFFEGNDPNLPINPNSQIIICDDIEEQDDLSILNFKENVYQGLVCGQKSFVWQIAKMENNEKYSTFTARTYYMLKSFADGFVRLASMFMKTEFKNRLQFITLLEANEFQKDDLPMFHYWLKIIPAFRNVADFLECPNRSQYIGTTWF